MRAVEVEIYSSPGKYTTARIWQDGANRTAPPPRCVVSVQCNCQTKKKQGGGRGGEGEGVNLPAAASSRRTKATCEDSGAPATRTLTNTGKGHVTAAQTAAIKQRLAACGVKTGHFQAVTLVVFLTSLFPHVPLSRTP